MQMIANRGHDGVLINKRLDALQVSIPSSEIIMLDEYIYRQKYTAYHYNHGLGDLYPVAMPFGAKNFDSDITTNTIKRIDFARVGYTTYLDLVANRRN